MHKRYALALSVGLALFLSLNSVRASESDETPGPMEPAAGYEVLKGKSLTDCYSWADKLEIVRDNCDIPFPKPKDDK